MFMLIALGTGAAWLSSFVATLNQAGSFLLRAEMVGAATLLAQIDALVTAIAVLVITCPCVLGRATPMSILVAARKGASTGGLFRDVDAIERLRSVDTLVVDKTGTLTEGRPRLVALLPAPGFTRVADRGRRGVPGLRHPALADGRGDGDGPFVGVGDRERAAAAPALTVTANLREGRAEKHFPKFPRRAKRVSPSRLANSTEDSH